MIADAEGGIRVVFAHHPRYSAFDVVFAASGQESSIEQQKLFLEPKGANLPGVG